MQCTVDEHLVEEARAVLGTSSAQETIEASLREVIRRRSHPPETMHTVERQSAVLGGAQQPSDEGELTRRRMAVTMAHRARVKVEKEFDVAEEIRKMREANFAEPDDPDETAR
jgi:hypothetical protein